MDNFLLNYLGKANLCNDPNIAGPVITISRECGCSANRIAIKLSKILTGYSYQSENKKDVEWKWYNKEIIEKAIDRHMWMTAKEAQEFGLIDEIITTFPNSK